jgi:pantoate--beta-alanine ligase
MKVITNIQAMQRWALSIKRSGKTIGFVPTMGCLHEGHISLIRRAKKENDVCVVSIFVNPAQFGPQEDFKKYPRDRAGDRRLAKRARADVLFFPSVARMYPSGYCTFVAVERLTEGLCGASRPGHFRGVTTVVAKLFNIVQPDRAYFGQKDAQQAAVVRRMTVDLSLPLAVTVMPTIREPGGLAMSSRNVYLDVRQRGDARVLYSSLQTAKKLIESGVRSPTRIKESLVRKIRSRARVDYVALVDALTLEPLTKLKGHVLIAVAAWVGPTRLIDNLVLRVRE